jgi:hypothetical protein
MRKLRLSVEELHVATFHTHAADADEGTVHAHQTEPASVGGPCTQTRCTYPPQLCRPHKEGDDAEPGPQKR